MIRISIIFHVTLPIMFKQTVRFVSASLPGTPQLKPSQWLKGRLQTHIPVARRRVLGSA